jgi:hypothetical protein
MNFSGIGRSAAFEPVSMSSSTSTVVRPAASAGSVVCSLQRELCIALAGEAAFNSPSSARARDVGPCGRDEPVNALAEHGHARAGAADRRSAQAR